MDLTQNLYTLTTSNDNIFEIVLANETHPVFQAHFPNNPILPGFLQIDIAEKLLGTSFKKIKKAKFLHIIKPNDHIFYECKENKIIIRSKKKKLSEIIYA